MLKKRGQKLIVIVHVPIAKTNRYAQLTQLMYK